MTAEFGNTVADLGFYQGHEALDAYLLGMRCSILLSIEARDVAHSGEASQGNLETVRHRLKRGQEARLVVNVMVRVQMGGKASEKSHESGDLVLESRPTCPLGSRLLDQCIRKHHVESDAKSRTVAR